MARATAAIILAAHARSGHQVQLFSFGLANVADIQIAVRGIESHPVRISQTVGPDLVGAVATDKRIGCGNGVVGGVIGGKVVTVDIDTQDLAEQRIDILRVFARVAAASAVTDRDIQEAVIGTEADSAAIVT